MKTKILFLLISIFQLSGFAQEHNNSKYYRLYKDGEKILRPIVYVLNNCTDDLQKTKNGKITFNIDNQLFEYLPNKHNKDSITLSEFKKIDFKKVKELTDLEHQEYLRAATKVLDKKGFKPVAPINHSILRVIVISKGEKDIFGYETDWLYSKF